MASRLLNVLENIERAREFGITHAKDCGYQIDSNASFEELTSLIDNNFKNKFAVPELNLKPWERPGEWPDYETIRDEAATYENEVPYMFVLLDASYSNTIELPISYQTNSYSTPPVLSLPATHYLTSDGTVYNTADYSTNIIHTWDSTQAINITTGDYPGTYYWLLVYCKGYNQFNWEGCPYIASWPAVELQVFLPSTSSGSNVYGGFLAHTVDDVLAKTLVNYEADFNYWPGYLAYKIFRIHNNAYSSGVWMRLRNFVLKNAYFYIQNNAAYSPTYQAGLLENIDMSQCPTYSMDTNISLFGDYNLKILKLPNTSVSLTLPQIISSKLQTVSISSNTRFYANNDNLYIDPTSPLYSIACNRIWSSGTPINLLYQIAPEGASISAIYVGPVTTMVDLSKCTQRTTDYSTIYTNSNSYLGISGNSCALQNFKVPNDCFYRLDLSQCCLSAQSLNDIVGCLKDLSEEQSIYNPWLKLNTMEYSLLTAESIVALSDKGWEVKF